MAKNTDLKTRLSKAKTSLILDHPFIGTIALNMPMMITENELQSALIPTAATDGKRIIFNPKFCEELTDEQLKFLVAHECMHPMLEHPFRRGEREHMKWNKAADYVINQLLVDEGIGKFIEGGCLDKNIYTQGGGTSDGIYNILPDTPEGEGYCQIGGNNGGGRAYDNIEDAGRTQQERNQMAAEWKVNVAQAAQAAKMMGKMSANMQRLVDEVLAPKVNWKDVLRKFVEKCKNDQRTFARPNRRFISQGLILPTISGEALGELCIAIDCSGSIGQKELNEFAAEIHAIKDDGNPVAMHLHYFDSDVCHYEKFTRDDDLHIEPHGGGGTAFSPVFADIEEKNIDPVACIFLTDLYCSDYGDKPPYPVLWVSTVDHGDAGYGKPPFGEVVIMKHTD